MEIAFIIAVIAAPLAPALQEGRDIGYIRAFAELSAMLTAGLTVAAAIAFCF